MGVYVQLDRHSRVPQPLDTTFGWMPATRKDRQREGGRKRKGLLSSGSSTPFTLAPSSHRRRGEWEGEQRKKEGGRIRHLVTRALVTHHKLQAMPRRVRDRGRKRKKREGKASDVDHALPCTIRRPLEQEGRRKGKGKGKEKKKGSCRCHFDFMQAQRRSSHAPRRKEQ